MTCCLVTIVEKGCVYVSVCVRSYVKQKKYKMLTTYLLVSVQTIAHSDTIRYDDVCIRPDDGGIKHFWNVD